MGLIDRILNTFNYEQVIERPKPPNDSWGDFLDSFIEELDATAIACVRVAVNMLAPAELRALSPDDQQPIPVDADNSGGHFNRAINRVTQAGSPFDFKARLITDLLIYGNAYVYPIYTPRFRNGEVSQRLTDMRIVTPSKVQVRQDESSGDLIFKVGEGRDLNASELLQIKYPSISTWDRLKGEPPLKSASTLNQIGLFASDRVLGNLKNGKTPIAIAYDANAGDLEGRKRFRRDQIAQRKSPWRIFAPGTDVKMVDFTAQETELGELRVQTRADIAMAYGVPGPLVGIDTTQWGQGLEQLKRLYWQTTLKAVASMIEQRLQSLVQYRYKIEFNELDFLRGDWADTAMFVKAGLGPNGIATTINEMRRMAYKLPPIAGGDVLQSPSVVVGLTANDQSD